MQFNENVEEYINKMVCLGKKASEDSESILLVIKDNLTFVFKREMHVPLSENLSDLLMYALKFKTSI